MTSAFDHDMALAPPDRDGHLEEIILMTGLCKLDINLQTPVQFNWTSSHVFG
jgi:hypothetical protein